MKRKKSLVLLVVWTAATVAFSTPAFAQQKAQRAAGAGVAAGSIIKFKQHKQNPNQTHIKKSTQQTSHRNRSTNATN
jgi:hypothetical protein